MGAVSRAGAAAASALGASALSSGFIVGKRITSRMESLFVSIMTQRSMPMPRPPVGGMPYIRALM